MKIVLIEDEEIQRISLEDDLAERGHEIRAFAAAEPALEMLFDWRPDLVLTDLRLPRMDGLEVVRRIRARDAAIAVIVMTAFSSVENAVAAMRLGAVDYLTKPFQLDELCLRLERIEREQRIQDENLTLRDQVAKKSRDPRLLGTSPATEELRKAIAVAAAEASATILLVGETGTGKDLAAELIHRASGRRRGPFIKLSCAMLSREMIESELFGHERGAFTGAGGRRLGRFEVASGGTLYLDEVDDIPLPLQVKLLRVLEERVIERVGGSRPIEVDVRIIAATKRNLRELVATGRFREDLFYRLNVYPIEVPPLRARREDIPLLFQEFLNRFRSNPPFTLAPATLDAIQCYDWPGNIRQVRNEAQRISIGCHCNPLVPDCLAPEIRRRLPAPPGFGNTPAGGLKEALAGFEIALLRQALEACNGNRTEAAARLNIPVTTLKSKLKRYGLE